MRGSKAKKLRRAAEAVTVGMPARQLLVNPQTGMVVNDPSSTRGVYRRWKRSVKKGHTPFTD